MTRASGLSEPTVDGRTYSTTGYWRGLMLVALVLGIAWINLSRLSDGATISAQAVEAPMTGFLAPDFTLVSTDGEQVSLSSLRGRPVVINFWATWCPPCRAEMPDLERLWLQDNPEGLVVLGVNQGEREDIVVRYARDEVGTTFPLLLDTRLEVGALYGVRAFPTTYFVDSDGRIQDIKIGGPLDIATLTASAAKIAQK
jgi:peroxiredoxin